MSVRRKLVDLDFQGGQGPEAKAQSMCVRGCCVARSEEILGKSQVASDLERLWSLDQLMLSFW